MTMTEPNESQLPPYQPLDGVENLNYYHAGGFHPVHLEDEFCDGRYRVIHKLGHGSYSVVWLAKDQQTHRYVALKILRAEASPSSNEGRILHILQEHRSQQPYPQGVEYVTTLVDEFDIDGANGRHKCLVSELAGYSIADSKTQSYVWLFPIEVARAISAKVILGVQFLHSSGIIHGDLHKANIMLKIPNVDYHTVDQLYERFGSPDTWRVEREDGKPLDDTVPSYAVPHMISSKACEEVAESDIIITDFGEAYEVGTESRDTLNTPQHLCPPEMLLRTGAIGMPADIWTLACTLVEIMGDGVLFETFFCDNDEVIAEIISCLGIPPEPVWKAWEKRGEFFTEDGEWALNEQREENLDGVFRLLEERIATSTKRDGVSLDDEERDAFVRMLRGMLAYEPQHRWKIEDVVRCEWMAKYGMPAITVLSESDSASSHCISSSAPSSTTSPSQPAFPEFEDQDFSLPSTDPTKGYDTADPSSPTPNLIPSTATDTTTIATIHGDSPNERTLDEQIPDEHIAVEQIPTEQIPTEDIPAEHIAVEHIAVEHIAVEHIPTEQIPAEQIAVEQIPTEQIPTEDIPAEHIAVEHIAVEYIAVEQIPTDQNADEQSSDEQSPNEESSNEESPKEESPNEESSDDESSNDEYPIEETPIEETPSEPNPFRRIHRKIHQRNGFRH
ncbi:MAG: hypothetical protein LQ352_008152 [Teloschistes flavicans]|nr:MAG: hypothetical protein LQ352_008152 [Teloschistes flavicans]